MSAIWYHDDQQRATIDTARDAIEARLENKVTTPILPLKVFHLAEDYHQKYRLQHSPLMNRFQIMYPEFESFNNSTAAARLNGYVAGYGSRWVYDSEQDSFGFPVQELDQVVRLGS